MAQMPNIQEPEIGPEDIWDTDGELDGYEDLGGAVPEHSIAKDTLKEVRKEITREGRKWAVEKAKKKAAEKAGGEASEKVAEKGGEIAATQAAKQAATRVATEKAAEAGTVTAAGAGTVTTAGAGLLTEEVATDAGTLGTALIIKLVIAAVVLIAIFLIMLFLSGIFLFATIAMIPAAIIPGGPGGGTTPPPVTTPGGGALGLMAKACYFKDNPTEYKRVKLKGWTDCWGFVSTSLIHSDDPSFPPPGRAADGPRELKSHDNNVYGGAKYLVLPFSTRSLQPGDMLFVTSGGSHAGLYIGQNFCNCGTETSLQASLNTANYEVPNPPRAHEPICDRLANRWDTIVRIIN